MKGQRGLSRTKMEPLQLNVCHVDTSEKPGILWKYSLAPSGPIVQSFVIPFGIGIVKLYVFNTTSSKIFEKKFLSLADELEGKTVYVDEDFPFTTPSCDEGTKTFPHIERVNLVAVSLKLLSVLQKIEIVGLLSDTPAERWSSIMRKYVRGVSSTPPDFFEWMWREKMAPPPLGINTHYQEWRASLNTKTMVACATEGDIDGSEEGGGEDTFSSSDDEGEEESIFPTSSPEKEKVFTTSTLLGGWG